MTPEQDAVARMIARVHCPECGERGHPQVVHVQNFIGTPVVLPNYQCDTPGCKYNHRTNSAWTPVSTS